MTSTKCIEHCRGVNQSFTFAILESEKCSCGTEHTLDFGEDYVLSKSKCKKVLTGGWNERTMIGDDSGDPNPTVAFYNIEHETNRYHGDQYGASTCYDVTRELMLTRYELHKKMIYFTNKEF